MANCAKCGACCERIFIGTDYETMMGPTRECQSPPEGYEERDPEHEDIWKKWDEYLTIQVRDALFLRVHWHPILENGQQVHRDATNPEKSEKGGKRYGYTCDAFDAESRLCTAQEKKPPICSRYPFYDGLVSKPDFRECSFWHDVPRNQWPEGIDPLPSPVDG